MKNKRFEVLRGDCLEVLKGIPDNSIDSCVTDPPYGMSQHKQADIVSALTAWLSGEPYIHSKNGFMGNEWDRFVPGPEVWRECLRVLKPGGHILCFASPRTQDLMGMSLRLAGFEIRDSISWVFGSGFPKSQNISKAIDKSAGVERKVVGYTKGRSESLHSGGQSTGQDDPVTESVTDDAKQWDGWGTGLKPGYEPIIMARKPLSGKTVVANVLEHGTGGINIDGCRVGTNDTLSFGSRELGDGVKYGKCKPSTEGMQNANGRWPANLIHDGSDEVVSLFPVTKSGSILPHHKSTESENRAMSGKNYARGPQYSPGSEGSAARFFYCAKTSKSDRNEGLDGFESKRYSHDGRDTPIENAYQRNNSVAQNNHPTVKPTDLMKYLARLVTPPGGVVIDPFMGSGSTGKGAVLEGFGFIGIEYDEHSFEIAEARVSHAADSVGDLFSNLG